MDGHRGCKHVKHFWELFDLLLRSTPNDAQCCFNMGDIAMVPPDGVFHYSCMKEAPAQIRKYSLRILEAGHQRANVST